MRRIIFLLLLGCLCKAQDGDRLFPEDFKFGVATASYQIEGAWQADGKGENIWDYLTHNKDTLIDDGSNGDVACNSYNKVDDDVELLVELRVQYYRFSISWSRILPTGHANEVNEAGVQYYSDLIDKLLENGITPLVTMYHWDLPQPLQEIGGWTSPVLVDLFVDYANVLFTSFGDRVTNWITFNEPYQICQQGYSEGTKAPAYTQDGVGGYLCGHTLLLAHAYTYHLYHDDYAGTDGRIGITVNGVWAEAASEDSVDQTAADDYIEFHFGWFFNPIYIGDYPQIMKDNIQARSELEGFPDTRLPEFTETEIALLRSSSDFLGLNHYTTYQCTPLEDVDSLEQPSFKVDSGVNCWSPTDWEGGASSWLKVHPSGLTSILNWIREKYDNPEVIITENGFSEAGEVNDLNDCDRVSYYNGYLYAVLDALEDGCQVSGYMAWSLMDNFEWMRGYSERFGLYYVDFEDEDRPRTAKKSALVYKNIIETRAIDLDYDPSELGTCTTSDEDEVPE